ncbi:MULTISPECIES: beta-lactamase regulator AmpE [Pseudoalteromonas]|uniref:Regulatory signaling modulator protein AmpE n=1 Tax=Pseudoalteromonas amylolytica TaxID=1859457 RepID=A0A1S1MUQ3_9GAMM|nr:MULTISPECIES: beta-lactamase regulator AmpE [Pseudoalteromonas]OHU88577.1 regulatory signaling modulator protein AmpE [Pseudoalteromonas sp. JW3]OHU90419.1 regulatory signaling modulator protein AmpE [Pseudoalteromonas amylolytica]
MILISIILALAIERLAARGNYWQMSFYTNGYVAHSVDNSMVKGLMGSGVGVLIWLVVPSILIAIVYHVFDMVLAQLILNTCLLLICIGCAHQRGRYKGYLNALTRGDNEAATLYALQMGQKRTELEQGGEWFGQTLVWINFRHYCCVLFWFVMLGAPGAVLYAITRSLFDDIEDNSEHPLKAQYSRFETMLHWLDWVPARLTSFGYLIIGNFSKGTSCWLKYVLDFNVSNRHVVTSTALAAEQIEQQYVGCTYEASCMMRLVKRNILFYLVLIALLTLFGNLA